MAAFRLVFVPPATAPFTHHHKYLPSPSYNNNKNPFRFLSLTSKQRLNLHLSHSQPDLSSSSTTLEPVIETPQQQNVVVSEEEELVDVSNTRVLIQNVPWTCTPDQLRSLFQTYGTVVDIEFSMYNKTRNRGLAFVSMSSHQEALAALTNLDSTEFEGRLVKLNWARPKKEKPVKTPPPPPPPKPVHNLFVANLPFQARANDLKDFFNADNPDNVVSAEIIFQDKPPRRSLGYGFVSFNTKADAEAALAAFQDKEFMGRPMRVAPSKTFLRNATKANIEAKTKAENESETKVDIESETKADDTESETTADTESESTTVT